MFIVLLFYVLYSCRAHGIHAVGRRVRSGPDESGRAASASDSTRTLQFLIGGIRHRRCRSIFLFISWSQRDVGWLAVPEAKRSVVRVKWTPLFWRAVKYEEVYLRAYDDMIQAKSERAA